MNWYSDYAYGLVFVYGYWIGIRIWVLDGIRIWVWIGLEMLGITSLVLGFAEQTKSSREIDFLGGKWVQIARFELNL